MMECSIYPETMHVTTYEAVRIAERLGWDVTKTTPYRDDYTFKYESEFDDYAVTFCVHCPTLENVKVMAYQWSFSTCNKAVKGGCRRLAAALGERMEQLQKEKGEVMDSEGNITLSMPPDLVIGLMRPKLKEDVKAIQNKLRHFGNEPIYSKAKDCVLKQISILKDNLNVLEQAVRKYEVWEDDNDA